MRCISVNNAAMMMAIKSYELTAADLSDPSNTQLGLDPETTNLIYNRCAASLAETKQDYAAEHKQTADDLNNGQFFVKKEVGPEGGEGGFERADEICHGCRQIVETHQVESEAANRRADAEEQQDRPAAVRSSQPPEIREDPLSAQSIH